MWTILYLPFGALSGFVTVALTFLATKNGLSISEGALLNGANMLTQWLKWLWAPIVDVTMAAGAWLGTAPALCELARDLTPMVVERQVQLWFRPEREELARAPALPAFIHFVADRAYYGVPLADPLPLLTREPGLKVCRHHGGEVTTADTLDRSVSERDVEDVRSYLRAHLPSGDGPLLMARVCMYANTPDHHFMVGAHPRWPHVVVLGGFSGHGFKMASVMGEIAADLVEHGRSAFDLTMFDPARFSPKSP